MRRRKGGREEGRLKGREEGRKGGKEDGREARGNRRKEEIVGRRERKDQSNVFMKMFESGSRHIYIKGGNLGK